MRVPFRPPTHPTLTRSYSRHFPGGMTRSYFRENAGNKTWERRSILRELLPSLTIAVVGVSSYLGVIIWKDVKREREWRRFVDETTREGAYLDGPYYGDEGDCWP